MFIIIIYYRIEDILLKDMVGIHEKYQDYITNLKEDCCILGYCRKSKTTRVRDKVVKSL